VLTKLTTWFSTRWWWVLAALATLALVLALTERGASLAGSGPTSVSYCRTAQLSVTMGANEVLAGGRVVTSLLRLTNTGPTCELVDDAPLVQPVAGARHRRVGRGDVRDNAFRSPVTVRAGQSVTSPVSVESLPAQLSRTCRARTVDGVIITDGLPTGTNRYVAHVFHGVCSNPLRDNVGAAWYVVPHG